MALDQANGTSDRREAVVAELAGLHEGEEIVYTGCRINCGGSQCVLKVRRKNGVITAIEPDDHYNPGVGREDMVATDSDLGKHRVQLRGCPMAWVWHKLVYSPDRILYPMKRVAGSRRGEAKFERISWDEALDLVANKMKEMVEKYGPFSIMTPYAPNSRLERLFGLWGAGMEGWGWCSMDPERLAMHLMAGEPGWSYAEGSNDMADTLLNTKMIVLWGIDPTATHFGPGHQLAYYLRMARERGAPVICIDPRYTVAAEMMADQWIPIKPGTDAAMMLAIGYVLITEGLYNKAFVEKYVDPRGFDEWRAYLLGEKDGVEKTPEWAEAICAVPAETTRGFAHLYARQSPTWLWKGWGVSRKSRGENSTRVAAALQAIMGYWGVAGGAVPFHTRFRDKPVVMMPYGEVPRRLVPKLYRSHRWVQTILLLDKVQSGEMSVDEYKAIIGWRAGPLPKRPLSQVIAGLVSGAGGGGVSAAVEEAKDLPTLPNPKMLMWGTYYGPGTNTLNNNADSLNDQLEALDRLEFIAWAGTQMAPMASYADVVLPLAEMTMETRFIVSGGYGGIANLTFLPQVVEPLGEARNDEWVYSELARRLGVEEYNRYYNGENWDEAWEQYVQDQFKSVQGQLEKMGIPAPTWEEFQKSALINLDEAFDEPWHGYRKFIEEGKPLGTRTGKIEFYAYAMEDESERGKVHFDDHGRLMDNLPNDWRDLPLIPAFQPMYRGMEHPDVKQYPLMLLTSYPRYRNHSTFWNVPWIHGECYRHAFWINVADAQPRGIKDGDLVRVSNDHGVAVLPAYVTERVMPGIVVIHHGGWYNPDENGVDWGCSPNVFLGDSESPVTAPLVTNLVQAEKYSGPPRKQASA